MFAFCVVALGFRVWPVMLCYVAFGVMVFGLCCLDLLVCCVVLLCCVVLRCVALRCVVRGYVVAVVVCGVCGLSLFVDVAGVLVFVSVFVLVS